jgi:hypothetical protein
MDTACIYAHLLAAVTDCDPAWENGVAAVQTESV